LAKFEYSKNSEMVIILASKKNNNLEQLTPHFS